MSKNISIKEGNVGKNFSGVKKIAIKDVGGNSTSYWVPEDETTLGTKHITENGTYKASEEKDEQEQSRNWYGYSEVTVSGIGKVTGIDPDTGNLMTFEKDENDNVTKKLAPASIKFLRAPYRTAYADGESIDLAGSIIAAFTSQNTQWEGDEGHPQGVIPYRELTLNPDKADASQADEGTYEEGTVVIKLLKMGVYNHEDHPPATYPYYDNKPYNSELTHSDGGYIVCSQLIAGSTYYVTNYNGDYYIKPTDESETWTSAQGFYWVEPDGYTASTNTFDVTNGWKKTGNGKASNQSFASTSNAFLNLDNETINRGMHKGQKITVKWGNVDNGKKLSTNFDIQVVTNENDSTPDLSGGEGGHEF